VNAPTRNLIDRYFAALNAENAEGIIGLFNPEGRQMGALAGQSLQGPVALRAFCEGFFSRFPKTQWRVRRIFESGPEVAVVWEASLQTPQERRIEFDGVHVFNLDPQGKISTLGIFWDPLPVIKAMNLS